MFLKQKKLPTDGLARTVWPQTPHDNSSDYSRWKVAIGQTDGDIHDYALRTLKHLKQEADDIEDLFNEDLGTVLSVNEKLEQPRLMINRGFTSNMELQEETIKIAEKVAEDQYKFGELLEVTKKKSSIDRFVDTIKASISDQSIIKKRIQQEQKNTADKFAMISSIGCINLIIGEAQAEMRALARHYKRLHDGVFNPDMNSLTSLISKRSDVLRYINATNQRLAKNGKATICIKPSEIFKKGVIRFVFCLLF